MTDLQDFLRRAAAEPFALGEWDCAMFVANWVREQTGKDPAADLRGTYKVAFGWKRIVVREGGLSALVRRLAERAGMRSTTKIAAGAVGVVKVLGVGIVGAIAAGDGMWAMKFTDGLVVARADVTEAWSLQCPK